MKRSEPRATRNSMDPLLLVKQKESVRQYHKEFEVVANARKDLNLEVVMGIFLYRLKSELQAEFKVGQFRSLTALMDKALELEERNLAWRDGGIRVFHRGGGSSKGVVPNLVPGALKVGGGSHSATYGERGGKGVGD